MMRKFLSIALAAMLVLTIFAGCGDAVSDLAGNVANAAKEELTKTVRSTLEEYKVEVVEIKTTVGKLNGDKEAVQFFCAALVKANSESLPQTCANALGKLFEDAGAVPQTGSQVENEYLEHKDVTYDHSDFSAGGYYTIYVYNSVIEKTK